LFLGGGLFIWNIQMAESGEHFLLCLVLSTIIALGALFLNRQVIVPARDAKARLEYDGRPPILILRTFKTSPGNLPEQNIKRTFGYQLDSKLNAYGPTVTFSKAPIIGPSVIQSDEESWQREVISFMERAGLILLFTGKGYWLLWELNQLIERRLLHKTVVVITPIFLKRDLEFLVKIANDFLIRDVFERTGGRWSFAELWAQLKALIERPEFDRLKHVNLDGTLLIRWSTDGEPVVFKSEAEISEAGTEDAILKALDLCVHVSGLRTEVGRQPASGVC
jgi:hypothetical protein